MWKVTTESTWREPDQLAWLFSIPYSNSQVVHDVGLGLGFWIGFGSRPGISGIILQDFVDWHAAVTAFGDQEVRVEQRNPKDICRAGDIRV
jgi:hypothetical protein